MFITCEYCGTRANLEPREFNTKIVFICEECGNTLVFKLVRSWDIWNEVSK